MASANVELVRSIFAAWERGDFSSAAWAHPDIESVYADGPSPGRWTGHFQEGSRDFVGAWKDFRVEAEEFRELDDERVLVLTRFSGRGKRSGLELARMGAKGAHVFHVCDGKVIKRTFYMDRERALADLGLASESDSPRS
jgi:ketosteroid isomerase-like protein